MSPDIIKILTDGGIAGVAICLIGSIAYVICKIVPIVVKSISDMRESIEANTKATVEMHGFLKNLNGKLKKGLK